MKVLPPAVFQDEEDDTLKPIEDFDEEVLLEYCHNLLVIDNRGFWVPSHLSVIECFENHLWSQHQDNCLVSSVCLLLLNDATIYSRKGFKRLAGHYIRDQENFSYKGFPSFTRYVRQRWMIHVRRCEEDGTMDRLSTLIKQFLGSPTASSLAYDSWHSATEFYSFELYNLYKYLRPASVAFSAICAFGFHTVLLDWWGNARTEYINENKTGAVLLYVAAISGSVSICNRLIAWDVKPDDYTIDHPIDELDALQFCGSALAAAAFHGRMKVAKLLLEAGADVNAQLQGDYGSALVAAAWAQSFKSVKLLLEARTDVNAQLQGNYGSVLAVAVRLGPINNIKLLLKAGADVHAQLQGDYGSALAIAASHGSFESVRLLIEAGADVNAQLQGQYGSALAAAASCFWWSKWKIKLLIKAGAQVNMQLQFGQYRTALDAVAIKDYYGRVKLLVHFRAEVPLWIQEEYGAKIARAMANRHSEECNCLSELSELSEDKYWYTYELEDWGLYEDEDEDVDEDEDGERTIAIARRASC